MAATWARRPDACRSLLVILELARTEGLASIQGCALDQHNQPISQKLTSAALLHGLSALVHRREIRRWPLQHPDLRPCHVF